MGGAGDERSDIYALGVMAFEMLTGRPPFQDPTVRDVLIGHIREDPPDIAAEVPDLPKSLLEFITRALKKNPDERLVDCKEILRLLDRRQRHFSVAAETAPKYVMIEGTWENFRKVFGKIQLLCEEANCQATLIKELPTAGTKS